MKLPYKILAAIMVIAAMAALALAFFPGSRFRYIVLHHTATDKGNYAIIRKSHLKRKMVDAAYHLIVSNGSTDIPLGHIEPTGRYKTLSHAAATRDIKMNIQGIHICVVGNYEEGPVPENLKSPLGHAIGLIQEKYGIPDSRVLFHRDVGQTLCPGKDITKKSLFAWIRSSTEKCPKDMAGQQKRVIGEPGERPGPVMALVFSGIAFFAAACGMWRWSVRNGV